MAKQPFVPVAQIIRFRYAGLHQGAPWVNGYAVHYTGAKPDNAALTSFASGLRTAWTTTFGTIATTLTTLASVQCWDITDASGSNGGDSTGFTGAINATPLLPVQSAVCVSWPVQNRWRGGHFRSYLWARSVNSVTNGRTLTTAESGGYQTAAQGFRTAVNALTINSSAVQLCGVRYFPTGFDDQGKPLVKTSGQWYAFGVPVVHNRLDSQRRRSGKEII